MARDHRKLRVFNDAHQLTLDVYRQTRAFPRDEWFGIRKQMRRAAVSIPTNIVEGSARRTTPEYLNFINIAPGSAGELHYLIDLARELELIGVDVFKLLNGKAEPVVKQLERLIQELDKLAAQERPAENPTRRAKNSVEQLRTFAASSRCPDALCA